MAEKVDAPNFRKAVNTNICAYSLFAQKAAADTKQASAAIR